MGADHIGIALVPRDGEGPDAVYRTADRPLYQANADGRDTLPRST